MTDWVVRRWARYGHERLYADTAGGSALGYLDLKTGEYHPKEVADLSLLQEALGHHLGAKEEVEEPSQHPNPTWRDLSTTRAGAAARERALAEREAQGWLRHRLTRVVGARTDERAWRIGADGEEAVAHQLARLSPEWRVLHAVPIGERGSDIDHVVIGPAGVFTVNAKHHPHTSIWVGADTFMVNGQRVPYIRNSRHEARRASRLLTERVGHPVEAVGIVAVMGGHKGISIRQQPKDGRVVVVRRKRISQYLSARPVLLGAHEVEAIFDIAKRSSTWCG